MAFWLAVPSLPHPIPISVFGGGGDISTCQPSTLRSLTLRNNHRAVRYDRYCRENADKQREIKETDA